LPCSNANGRFGTRLKEIKNNKPTNKEREMTQFTKWISAAALGAMASMAQAADDLTLQLKWVTQAQFGGYYVALDKGFYEEEGLNVTIKPGGPDIAPTQVLAGGGADVTVEWMPAALAAREKGLPMVNIAQPFKSSGMMLTCRKDAGISSTDDFAGKTLGVWFFGNEFPFLSWMSKLGLSTEGGDAGVTVLKQGFNVDPLLQKQAACVSTMTYNEYWQVIDAGLTPDDLMVFKYEDQGVATLEDGLYVLEDALADPAMEDKLVRFVRASMKGWKYAEANPDEAADIVLENDASGAQTEEHQQRMMREIAKLTSGSNGALIETDYERTVQSLLSGGSDPVITKAPEGAWTHAITDKALNSSLTLEIREGRSKGWPFLFAHSVGWLRSKSR
jgi:NitT/TauT family transport system substrate-binding protein